MVPNQRARQSGQDAWGQGVPAELWKMESSLMSKSPLRKGTVAK